MRIGFACKYVHDPFLSESLTKKKIKEIEQGYTEKGTTATWLRNQPREIAEERLLSIVAHNAAAASNLIDYVHSLPSYHHMVRLGSSQIPMYTHPEWKEFWQESDKQDLIKRLWQPVGQKARDYDIRLSFHPGQFVVLASDKPDIVEASIEEFEYHADLIRYMGFGKQFQDFKCNVHISGRRGPAGIKEVLGRLSPEARNTITIENEEITWGLDDVLELEKEVPIVFDYHHHWVKTGEYLEPTDLRWQRVLDSWRGVRPTMHLSQSKEGFRSFKGITESQMVDLDHALSLGCKKSKLRAHSDMMWNKAVNQHAAQFLSDADIMIEAKMKNLAAIDFAKQVID